MPEYIEREALIEHIKDLPTWDYIAKADGVYEKSTKYPEGKFNCDDVINSINNAPAADAAEVKHGYWETKPNIGGHIVMMRCSVCAFQFDNWRHIFDYCPVCGAKMDGVSNG